MVNVLAIRLGDVMDEFISPNQCLSKRYNIGGWCGD